MAVQGVGGVGGIQPSIRTPARPAPPEGTGKASFGDTVGRYLQSVNQDYMQSDQVVRDLVTGNTGDVHDVVMAVAKADLAFRMVLEIRNRLIDSYQEIMRMQV